MLLTLTVTAYMFQRDETERWIERLRAVSFFVDRECFPEDLERLADGSLVILSCFAADMQSSCSEEGSLADPAVMNPTLYQSSRLGSD